MSETTHQIKQLPSFSPVAFLGWKWFFLVVFGLSFLAKSSAQSWIRTFPAVAESDALLPTLDGGYLLTGRAGDPNVTANDDAFLLKTDIDGRVQWYQTYGGADRDDAKDMTRSADGGIVVAGSSNSFSQGADIFVFKTNETGQQLWANNFGPDNSTERANDIQNTNDNGFLVTGCRSCFSTPEVYLIKIDQNGDEVWSQTYSEATEGMAVEVLTDGYLIAAITDNTTLDFLSQFILLKTDFDGNLLWTQTYGSTADSLDVRAILPLSDGLLFTGTRKTQGQVKPNAYLFKTDFNGDSLWLQDYGDVLEGENAFAFTTTPSNTILVTGGSFQNGTGDYFFLETDLDGNELSFQTFGGPGEETGKGIVVGPDGRFTVAGIQRFFNGNQIAQSDGLLVTATPQGNTVRAIIQGRVFLDDNNSCSDDAEAAGTDWIITAKGVDETFYARPDDNGFYELQVDTGTYTLAISGLPHWQTCQSAITVEVGQVLDSATINFPMQVQHDCAVLQVDLATASLVRCVDNRYQVRYCNRGAETATNVFLELQLPEVLTISRSRITPVPAGDQRFRFDLGDIPPHHCDTFSLDLLLDCATTLLGETHCLDAQIFPQANCLPVNPTWDNASLALEAVCENDTVQALIRNQGSGAMSKGQQIIIVEDDIVSRTIRVQLDPGEEQQLALSPAGQTLRLQGEQSAGHPGQSRPSLAVEGCGQNDLGDFSRGFVNQYSEDDGDLFRAVDCRESVDGLSMLPNKFAFPKGRTAEQLIPANTDLEYLLTFINPGPDTIHRVILRDSIVEALQLSGLEMGAASHPYRYEVLYTGWLKITFDSIELLPGATGFVQYRIPQQLDNVPGTKIHNRTSIILGNHPPLLSDSIGHTVARGEFYETQELIVCDRTEFLQTTIRRDTTLRDTFPQGFSDSIQIYILDHQATDVDIQQVDLCEGDSLAVGNSIYTQSGIYLDSLPYTTNDCDSLILATEIILLEVEQLVIDTLIRRGAFYRDILIQNDTTIIDTLVGSNGCDSLNLISIAVTTVSNPTDPQSDFRIKVFPNPVQSQLRLEWLDHAPRNLTVRLLDLQGQTLQQYTVTDIQNMSIPMQSYASGVYLLEVRGSDLYGVYRITK